MKNSLIIHCCVVALKIEGCDGSAGVWNIYKDNKDSLLICRSFFSLSRNVCCMQNRGINYKANFGLVVNLTPDENVICGAAIIGVNLSKWWE
mgnify:FL=1